MSAFHRGKAVLGLVLLLTLGACGKPLPADKSDYAGHWQEKDVVLVIVQDGTVHYRRRHDKGTTSVNAPIIRFEGDNFLVGLGPLNTTFVVERTPYREQGAWKMRVDGVTLVRQPASAGARF
jgi:hypothetical protein